MTRVSITVADGVAEVRASGHADTVEACAAVSTLMGSLVCYLNNSNVQVIDHSLEPGESHVRYSAKSQEARIVTRYVTIAFLQLHLSGAVDVDDESCLGEILD